MNPFKLIREGTDTVVGQACGACGRVFDISDGYAARCCDKASQERERVESRARFDRECAEKDARALASAARIPAADYEGPVYCEDEPLGNEGYFADLDALCEEYRDEQRPLPAEVWACTSIRFQIGSAQEIVDRALESDDYHEDMSDFVTGVAALQIAVDAFNAEQSGETWHVDYSRRVVLDAPEATP